MLLYIHPPPEKYDLLTIMTMENILIMFISGQGKNNNKQTSPQAQHFEIAPNHMSVRTTPNGLYLTNSIISCLFHVLSQYNNYVDQNTKQLCRNDL